MHSPLSSVYVKNDPQLNADENFAFGYFETSSPHVSSYCNGTFSYGPPYIGHNSSSNHNKMERFHNYSSYNEPQPSFTTYESEKYTARFSECYELEQCFQSEVTDLTNIGFEIPESPESLSSSSYNYQNTEQCMREDVENCDFSSCVKRVEQCNRDCNEIGMNYFVNNGNNGAWNTTIDDRNELSQPGEFVYDVEIQNFFIKIKIVL